MANRRQQQQRGRSDPTDGGRPAEEGGGGRRGAGGYGTGARYPAPAGPRSGGGGDPAGARLDPPLDELVARLLEEVRSERGGARPPPGGRRTDPRRPEGGGPGGGGVYPGVGRRDGPTPPTPAGALLLVGIAAAVLYVLYYVARRGRGNGGGGGRVLMTEEERREMTARLVERRMGGGGATAKGGGAPKKVEPAGASAERSAGGSGPRREGGTGGVPRRRPAAKKRAEAKNSCADERRDGARAAAVARFEAGALLPAGAEDRRAERAGAGAVVPPAASAPGNGAEPDRGVGGGAPPAEGGLPDAEEAAAPPAVGKPAAPAPLPPAQILCEALSSVTGLDVAVAGIDSGGSMTAGREAWAGIGWRRRKKSAPRRAKGGGEGEGGGQKVALPLLRFDPAQKTGGGPQGRDAGEGETGGAADVGDAGGGGGSDDDDDDDDDGALAREKEWSDLRRALSALLGSPSDDGNPLRARLHPPTSRDSVGAPPRSRLSSHRNLLRTAARWHARSRTAPRDMESLCELDRAGVSWCLAELGGFAAGACGGAMAEQIAREGMGAEAGGGAESAGGDDDEVELGLFEDSYSPDAGIPQKVGEHEETDVASGVMGDLLSLLDAGPPAVSGPFLVDLVRSCDGFWKSGPLGGAADGSGSSACASPTADVLLRLLLSRLPSPESSAVVPAIVVHRRLGAISNAVTLCPDVARALAARLGAEAAAYSHTPKAASAAAAAADSSSSGEGKSGTKDKGGDKQKGDETEGERVGRSFEKSSVLRPLLSLAAYALPEPGDEAAPAPPASFGADRRWPRFFRELDAIPQYPLCAYDRRLTPKPPPGAEAVNAAAEGARGVMRAARATAATALRRAAAATKDRNRHKRGEVLDWIGVVVRSNDALVNILETELLSPDGINGLCSSRSFLLGTASSILGLCCRSLVERFEKQGVEGGAVAFDVLYLMDTGIDGPKGGMLGIGPDERRLLPDAEKAGNISSAPTKFAGAVEFFFLTGALLRVGLFPSMRVEEEFSRKHETLFAAMEQLAKSQSSSQGAGLPEQFRRTAGASLGWSATLNDPELVAATTDFALLQLRWLVAVVEGGGAPQMDPAAALALIPEWMCKLPAQWIARVATRSPRLLKPHQGEASVRYATQLLRVGSGAGNGGGRGRRPPKAYRMSPPVLTELIRIAGAFVRAGVNRARQKEWAKHYRRRRPRQGGHFQEEEEDDIDIIDERDLNIYISFDANDLGVTVFTNRFVSTELCPTLMSTFIVMDTVEGMDVEREHHFHKNQVKSEIADLILRLWAHPSGECRASIAQLENDAVARFGSSVAAAFGMTLDDDCHSMVDMRNLLKGRPTMMLSRDDQMFYDHKSKHIAGGLAASRRLLLLLSCISEETRIASILGGGGNESGSRSTVSTDLAAMFIHFVDQLTGEDGGTHPDLDLRRSKTPTSVLVTRQSTMAQAEKKLAISDLLEARKFVLTEFGFDVSITTHWLLALAARWHLAARCDDKSSPFLDAVVANEDCNILQLRNICSRLIIGPTEVVDVNADNAKDIFECDGHIEATIKKKAEFRARGNNRAQRYSTKQDQMTHSQIDLVASIDDIAAFLDDLAQAASKLSQSSRMAKLKGEADITNLEGMVLNSRPDLTEEDYSEHLQNWMLSSESFLSASDGGSYAHCYDSNARAHEGIRSGRVMFKEARKCQRNIPTPHPNASIFVCFDEDRMDLCRAVIIGAVDTPYSLGMFEFDIYFPATYPNVSPLMTFKTTGGGTVRFSPNLYTDGKVCISILGTSLAWSETQRWNPKESSLVQVLVSIQAQILGVKDPFFNEGFGHETMKGSHAGQEGAKRYDSMLRLATLRHAIIGQIKKPPVGFEDVMMRHFCLCRRRLLLQAWRWTTEAKGTTLYPRFQRAYKELVVLLSSDQLRFVDPEDKEVQGSLPPLDDDLKALNKLDPSFIHKFGLNTSAEKSPGTNSGADRKTKAAPKDSVTVSTPNVSPDFNPWANISNNGGFSRHGDTGQNSDDRNNDSIADSDNELYL